MGSVGGCPLVRGSGGSCDLVQEISYSKIFLIFDNLRLFMMTTNLFVIANVKQLRTGGSFRILLPVFRISWGAGFVNSAIFNNFHNRVEFGKILEGLLGTPLFIMLCCNKNLITSLSTSSALFFEIAITLSQKAQ